MKAVLCRRFDHPSSLTLEDVPSPTAGEGQVVVSVKVAGVNFPDALMVQGKYQHKPAFPFAPGHEYAGIVKEVGPGVSGFRIGDRVCGQVRSGAFAEELAVTVDDLLVSVPPKVDLVSAGAFALAYGTSFHALRDRAQIQRGESVLVLGASGGVGLAAVQLGKLLGARVIACASSEQKLETCKRYGADEVVNYETQDLREAIKSLTGGKGVDVVCDQVGGSYAEPALRSMAWKGRYCVVGFAAGEIPKIPLNLVLLKGCSIVGVGVVSNARRDSAEYKANLSQMLRWMETGELMPVVTATYTLARAGEALSDVMSRKVQGKAVVVMA